MIDLYSYLLEPALQVYNYVEQEEVLQSIEQIPENTTLFAEACKGWLNGVGWDEIYILNKSLTLMLTVGN